MFESYRGSLLKPFRLRIYNESCLPGRLFLCPNGNRGSTGVADSVFGAIITGGASDELSVQISGGIPVERQKIVHLRLCRAGRLKETAQLLPGYQEGSQAGNQNISRSSLRSKRRRRGDTPANFPAICRTLLCRRSVSAGAASSRRTEYQRRSA